MSGPELSVGHGVIDEMVRLAALEIPGVARVSRGGPGWRTLFVGPAIVTRLSERGVRVRVWIVARPGQSLVPLAGQVREAVGAAVERLLDLQLESVTVTVDGVGG
ncbi:MAG TPA: Asp23/Gls24 family envelope stress response protein [Verrucomicrobiae bacterium]|jgi:uncharacterized alkaline shock family protein YloU|nr:Asp23/Gls24 family envelope stress response protein [Verrucomicrobiae bacterium]